MTQAFRLHVLGIPHTQTTQAFTGCAFTQKVHKFLRMMSGRGHEIFHYGHTQTDWSYPDVEHVPVVTEQDHLYSYGRQYVHDETWRERGFAAFYDVNDYAHKTFHANAIKEIAARKQPYDIVLHFWGWGHKPIADALPDLINIEPGIGYPGAWARWRVYESHAVMNALAGPSAVAHCEQNWYHRVIPNYFDADDFTYSNIKDNYILFLGRIGRNKGVDIAIDACERAGKQLVIAGQGSLADVGYTQTPDHVTMLGYADTAQRRDIMSRAQGLFIASTYLEPFAGVQVEAWLSGTPVISPDWAAFAEMNLHGVTGYRCHNMREFVQAVNLVGNLDNSQCRSHGEQYLLEHVAPQYESYFQDVMSVYTGAGWYEMKVHK